VREFAAVRALLREEWGSAVERLTKRLAYAGALTDERNLVVRLLSAVRLRMKAHLKEAALVFGCRKCGTVRNSPIWT